MFYSVLFSQNVYPQPSDFFVFVPGLLCGGGECDWPEDGLLCAAAFVGPDRRALPPQEEGHRGGVAQVLLLHRRPHRAAVSTLSGLPARLLLW